MLRKGENLFENGKIWSYLVKQKTNKKKKRKRTIFITLLLWLFLVYLRHSDWGRAHF